MDSKINLRDDGSSSSAFIVITSSLPATFNIFDKFSIDKPKVKGLSHLYGEKPFSYSKRDTRATCEESIAYIERPDVLASILTFFTKSFIASTNFLNITPSSKRASNIGTKKNILLLVYIFFAQF